MKIRPTPQEGVRGSLWEVCADVDAGTFFSDFRGNIFQIVPAQAESTTSLPYRKPEKRFVFSFTLLPYLEKERNSPCV